MDRLRDRGIIHRSRNRNKLYTGRCNLRFHTFWCVVFSVIAVIVMQGMAARIGIITQEGLAENMKHDFADRPLLRNILCGLVIIAITIGGLAYMGGDLTGTAMGASALTGVPTRIMLRS